MRPGKGCLESDGVARVCIDVDFGVLAVNLAKKDIYFRTYSKFTGNFWIGSDS